MCRLFREFLTDKGFVEIHTPKIISGMGKCEELKDCLLSIFNFTMVQNSVQSCYFYLQMVLCMTLWVANVTGLGSYLM